MSLFQSKIQICENKINKLEIAEIISEICENYSILFIIIHSCPYRGCARVPRRRRGGAGLGPRLRRRLPPRRAAAARALRRGGEPRRGGGRRLPHGPGEGLRPKLDLTPS